MRTLPLVLWVFLAWPQLPWADDEGETVVEIEAAARESAYYPEIRKAQEEAQQRTERWKKQRQSGRREDILDDMPLEKMLARLPEGPAYLDDLRAEAAEEQRQLAKQGIENAVEHRAKGDDIKPLYRNYLLAAYGDTSTELGRFITEALSSPKGWMKLPYISYKSLPANIAGLYTGEVFIDPGKGNNIVVVSHEHWHHMGKPDAPQPDNAAEHEGSEFAGGGKGNAPNDEGGGASYLPLMCGSM